jgi:hypothetical protein
LRFFQDTKLSKGAALKVISITKADNPCHFARAKLLGSLYPEIHVWQLLLPLKLNVITAAQKYLGNPIFWTINSFAV